MISKSSSCPAMIFLASITSSLGRLMFLLMKLFGIECLLEKSLGTHRFQRAVLGGETDWRSCSALGAGCARSQAIITRRRRGEFGGGCFRSICLSPRLHAGSGAYPGAIFILSALGNETLRLLSDATSGFSVCFAVRADTYHVPPASIHAATVCAPTSSIHRKA